MPGRVMVWLLVAGCGSGPQLPSGPVTLTVPGALNLAVHCGGNTTLHQPGETARFVPEGPVCDIEAPLSPVMPLRGRLQLSRARSYRCDRDDMDLHCRPTR